MYLLDTDILSNLIKRAPSTDLIAKLASIPPEEQFTSSITAGELLYGALRLGASGSRLLNQIEQRILSNLAVLPFDVAAARSYGRLRADVERRGASVGDADLRIAAIAHARELTVVTGNVREFARIPGIQVENWLTG